MKKLVLLTAIMFFTFVASFSQDAVVETWNAGGTISINASQTSFTNWVAGGENSYGGTAFLNLFSNYRNGLHSWDNTLDLGFGLMKQESRPLFKTDDKIDFSSKYGIKAAGNWYCSSLLGFKTQFYEGKRSISDTTKISNFMAPAYISLSIGMDYKPNDNFSLFISPASARLTFVLDTVLSSHGAFGVKPGEKMRFELGGYVRVLYKVNLWKSIDYTTKLELFSNYLDEPQNVDVNWENTLNFKINDYISANIYLTLLYDDDSRIRITNEDGTFSDTPKLQVREIFGVGFTYKF